MSFIQKLKSYLPVSSRSFHAMDTRVTDELARLDASLERIYARIEQADAGINGNIDFKFDELALPELHALGRDLQAHDTHAKMLLWESVRREGEDLEQTHLRFFRGLPKAQGRSRLIQLACAQLLAEFDELCRANGIPYWVACGTLLGAWRHEGFIPWDDDVDLGMLRQDIERLVAVVQQDARYRVTVAYDFWARCRQVRFWYADKTLPCFLDLFIFDGSSAFGRQAVLRQNAVREEMIKAQYASAFAAYWREHPLVGQDDAHAAEIAQSFDDALARLRAEGLLVDVPLEDCPAVIWSVDNVYDRPADLYWASPIDEMLPLAELPFEGHRVLAPQRPRPVLERVYSDPLALPGDIHSHFRHVSDEENAAEAEALARFAEPRDE